MDFEYDPNKSLVNKENHGIDFEEAKDIWDDGESITFELPFAAEDRSMVIGMIGEIYWSAIIT